MELVYARVTLLLVLTFFAGCADSSTPGPGPEDERLEVTDSTGGIRGVVVDTRITPIEGATVRLHSGQETTTSSTGVFTFTGLEPGTYFVTAQKVRYEEAQSSTLVVAGVENPPVLTIQIAQIVGADPYLEIAQLDGFYDCAFALFFITDSCDFVVRTAHDAGAPVPRGIQNNVNTMYWLVTDPMQTIIQESFWDPSVTNTFRASVDSTPIDNLCDCSDDRYLVVSSDTGHTYGRLDEDTGAFPPADQDVALRGFLPFQELTEADYALSLEFQIFTAFFHNYHPQDGWNLEERGQYPVPS